MKALVAIEHDINSGDQADSNFDEHGQLTEDWQLLYKTKAKREHVGGSIQTFVNEAFASATDRFILPFKRDFELRFRIVLNGRIYRIIDVDNFQDCNRELHVLTEMIR